MLNLNLAWLLQEHRPSYLSAVLLSTYSQPLSIFSYRMQTIFKLVNMKRCKVSLFQEVPECPGCILLMLLIAFQLEEKEEQKMICLARGAS